MKDHFLSRFLQGKQRSRLENRERVICLDVGLKFFSLLVRDSPLLLLGKKVDHPPLVLVADTKAQNKSCSLRRHLLALRFQGTAEDGGTGRLRAFSMGLHHIRLLKE